MHLDSNMCVETKEFIDKKIDKITFGIESTITELKDYPLIIYSILKVTKLMSYEKYLEDLMAGEYGYNRNAPKHNPKLYTLAFTRLAKLLDIEIDQWLAV